MAENLLHSVQAEAVDSESDLASLLRKCRVMAQRLGNEDLKQWVVAELDGYAPNGLLPEYRIHRSPIIIGEYLGGGGVGLSNVRIPVSAVREDLRDFIVPVKFYQGVDELSAQIQACEDSGFMNIAIPPEALGVIRYENVAPHLVLADVKKIVATAVIEGILSTVRNRILNFTLELEEFAPSTGDPLKMLKEERPADVQKVFHTQIWGDVGNLNQGGNHVSQVSTISKGDTEGFGREMARIGLSDPEVQEFKAALASEAPNADGSWGKRVSAQFGKAMQKAGEGALKIPGSVAGSLIAEAIKNFYGM